MQELVHTEVQRWASKGINIRYETRSNRKGYKAGALREGMVHAYVRTCEHVAIFDADFQPEPDFLMRTIPFLIQNSQIALVQARWKFGKVHSFPYSHYIHIVKCMFSHSKHCILYLIDDSIGLT